MIWNTWKYPKGCVEGTALYPSPLPLYLNTQQGKGLRRPFSHVLTPPPDTHNEIHSTHLPAARRNWTPPITRPHFPGVLGGFSPRDSPLSRLSIVLPGATPKRL